MWNTFFCGVVGNINVHPTDLRACSQCVCISDRDVASKWVVPLISVRQTSMEKIANPNAIAHCDWALIQRTIFHIIIILGTPSVAADIYGTGWPVSQIYGCHLWFLRAKMKLPTVIISNNFQTIDILLKHSFVIDNYYFPKLLTNKTWGAKIGQIKNGFQYTKWVRTPQFLRFISWFLCGCRSDLFLWYQRLWASLEYLVGSFSDSRWAYAIMNCPSCGVVVVIGVVCGQSS